MVIFMARLLFIGALAAGGLAVAVQMTEPGGAVFLVSYGGIGSYLAVRRPSNPIGWLLMLIGGGLALGSTQVDIDATALAMTDPLTAARIWANGCGWSLAFLGMVGLCLVFPAGELPPGRWVRPLLAATAVVVLAIAFHPVLSVTGADVARSAIFPNPLAIAPESVVWSIVPSLDVLYSTLFGLVALSVGSLLARARAATGVVRLQFRWLVAAIALVVVVTVAWALATFVLSLGALEPVTLAVLIAYPLIPLAIAVAVLRYRLYEIDRLISRSLSWAIVSGVLAAVFAVGVLGLQALFADVTQGETLAVAASTLGAFALFQPVRSRVQRAVDRRFDRGRYDAELTAAAFAGRLRDKVDLDALADELRGTVERAVLPTHSAIWFVPGAVTIRERPTATVAPR